MSGEAPGTRPEERYREVADTAVERLERDRSVRRRLPGRGRLYLDRRLPYLAVHRRAGDGTDRGMRALVASLSSHLITRKDRGAEDLGRAVVRRAAGLQGSFLLIELWAGPAGSPEDVAAEPIPRPRFRIHAHDPESPAVEALTEALCQGRFQPGVAEQPDALEWSPVVERCHADRIAPEGLPELLPPDVRSTSGAELVGLEVSPVFRDPVSGTLFPRVLEALRREVARAVEAAAWAAARAHGGSDLPDPRSLGRRVLEKAVRSVDRRLGAVADAFDLLLHVTPVNAEAAWCTFRDAGFQRAPRLLYRPLPFDPEGLKRRIFAVPIDHIEDPTLAHLYREKQEELDRQVTLLRDIATPAFLPGSIQLYGAVEPELLALAREMLERLDPARDSAEEYPEDGEPGYVDARGFADRAREEFRAYQEAGTGFSAGLEIRDDLTAGLMVLGDVLCVSDTLRIPHHRVRALLQHEVGTHLVTYCNGRAQPLRQFASGLAGYTGFQEGLAVLSEFVVGGLSLSRTRVLAGRVVAARCVEDGGTLVDTFRVLTDGHGFAQRTAFIIALRVHRGGGFTKDAVYLRGLQEVLAYLKEGGDLEPLFVGKIGRRHLEAVRELRLRGVLEPPAVIPRWLRAPGVEARLERCRRDSIVELLEEAA